MTDKRVPSWPFQARQMAGEGTMTQRRRAGARMTKLAVVEELYPSNFRNVPASLRHLADEIEVGKYGEVSCVALAMLADTLRVFGLGPDSAGSSVHLMLGAAMRSLEQALLAAPEDAP